MRDLPVVSHIGDFPPRVLIEQHIVPLENDDSACRGDCDGIGYRITHGMIKAWCCVDYLWFIAFGHRHLLHSDDMLEQGCGIECKRCTSFLEGQAWIAE